MKARRQKKILAIISREQIETQEELAELLRESGYVVTQATVSRDVKELGLIKIPGENNSSYYALPGREKIRFSGERLERIFLSSVQHVDFSENLVIIKTLPGEAQGVASALDQAGWQEIIGTVAGDDTILVVVKPKTKTVSVVKRFKDLAGG